MLANQISMITKSWRKENIMKKEKHNNYVETKVTCACGNTFTVSQCACSIAV